MRGVELDGHELTRPVVTGLTFNKGSPGLGTGRFPESMVAGSHVILRVTIQLYSTMVEGEYVVGGSFLQGYPVAFGLKGQRSWPNLEMLHHLVGWGTR